MPHPSGPQARPSNTQQDERTPDFIRHPHDSAYYHHQGIARLHPKDYDKQILIMLMNSSHEQLFHSVHFRLALLLINEDTRAFLAKSPTHNEIAKRLDPNTPHEYQEPPRHAHNDDKYDYSKRFLELMQDPDKTAHPDEEENTIMTVERANALHKEHSHDWHSHWFTDDTGIVPLRLHQNLREGLNVPENRDRALQRWGRCIQMLNPHHDSLKLKKERELVPPPNRSWSRDP